MQFQKSVFKWFLFYFHQKMYYKDNKHLWDLNNEF